MSQEHLVSFLKHRTIISGQATVELRSEIEYTVVAGEDENSMVQAMTFCKNGLIVLSNSETQELWSNRKPVIVTENGKQVFTFETE
ncbi:hypothetical protein [Streptococcus sp. S784/96/1]|uniref:hypothetical protein n=1 Tax=Streptococcus sp. S784/96/1 TaxID=2653499 RepID=UPI00138736C8|nr:hypothetical protein [Streptococcus sp. S784/96/1]